MMWSQVWKHWPKNITNRMVRFKFYFSDILLTLALLRCHNESLSKRIEEGLRITSKSRWTIRNWKGDYRSRKSFILYRCIRDATMDLVLREGNIRDVCYLFEAFSLQYLTPSRPKTALTSSGTPESRVGSVRDRLNIIKQCVLRNEHFAPSTLPSRDREKLVTVSLLRL